MRGWTVVAALVAAVTGSGVGLAEEKPWELSLGLSYLATGGNSSSSTAGVDVAYTHDFAPWGLKAEGSFLRAESEGIENAKRLFAGIRGTRAFDGRWKGFLGASGLEDRYAGLDRRVVLEGGAIYTAVASDRHELSFDGGAAWTRDDLVAGSSESYMSGVAGLAYAWKLSETAKVTQRVVGFPGFEQPSKWRVESGTTLEAALTSQLAVKVGYWLRYASKPVPGFGNTDSKTSASLVISF